MELQSIFSKGVAFGKLTRLQKIASEIYGHHKMELMA